jgi:replicative DNA helicase
VNAQVQTGQSSTATSVTRETLVHVDAERGVLAALLLAGAADEFRIATEVASLLTPKMFGIGAHRVTYEAMEALRQDRIVIDPITLLHKLEAMGTLQVSGGATLVGGLLDEIPTTANVMHHVGIVREFWKRREVAALGQRMQQMAQDRQLDVDEVFSWASKALAPLASSKGEQGFRRIKQGLWTAMERIEQRKSGTAATLVPTYLRELDARLNGGVERGELIIVAGVPSCGKTTLVWNWLRELAICGAGATGFVSAEMSEGMLLESALAAEAAVPRANLKSGKLTDAELSELAGAAGRLLNQAIYVDDTVMPAIGDVENRCRLLKTKEPGLVAIGVDFIQLLQDRDRGRGELRSEQITQIVYRLKSLALELGVIVVALAQPNDKQVEDRDDKRVQLRDLQGSSGMRQAADHVWLLYRPHMYDPTQPDTIEINLAKQKAGATGTAILEWDGPRLRVISPEERRLREHDERLKLEQRRQAEKPIALPMGEA